MLTAAREAGMVSRTVAALTPDDQVQDQDDECAEEDGNVGVGGCENPSSSPDPSTQPTASPSNTAKNSTTAKDRKKLSVEECLYLATRGGAACLNLSNKIGAFEVGMEWDAQLIKLATVPQAQNSGSGEDDGDNATKTSTTLSDKTTPPPPTQMPTSTAEDSDSDPGLVELWGKETWPEKVAKWLFCGDDRNTKRVFVRGRLVWER